MSFLAKIDADGFHDGMINAEFLDPKNLDVVVFEPLPVTPLQPKEKWRWVNGAWVATVDHRGHAWYDPDSDAVHKPTRWDDAPPPGFQEWVPGQNKVLNPNAALAQARKAKREALRKAEEAEEYSTFTWNGKVFSCSLPATQRLLGAGMRAQAGGGGGPPNFTWELADGSTVVLSVPDMINVTKALADHQIAVATKGRQRRQAVEAATTVEEVDAITW